MDQSNDTTTAVRGLVHGVDTWHGGVVPPRGFRLRQGEALYRVDRDVELVELTQTPAPLQGGTSELVVADALRMAGPAAARARAIWCSEDVPGLDTGEVLVTDQRVVFVGEDFRREWSFAELLDITHDPDVPESWLLVRSRERMSGLRYGRGEALDLRFAITLALASARGDRARLREALLQQLPAPVPTGAGGIAKLRSVVALVYLGKRGVAAPLRVLQGAVAVVLTLGLLGAALGGVQESERTDLAVTRAASSDLENAPAAGSAADAARAAADRAAADRAAADSAARQAEATKAAADQAIADRAAARAAAERAAADRAAADRAAAEAADRAAAERAAAEAANKAAADRAAAEAVAKQAAADRAAAERAAAAEAAAQEAQRQAARKAQTPSSAAGCVSAYPDFCVPVGADLDCPDFSQSDFTALPADPYRLDADNDGYACDS